MKVMFILFIILAIIFILSLALTIYGIINAKEMEE